MRLPESFVWTRYGTEAGEDVNQIFARKDRERVRNGGVFVWGIGNSIANSARMFLWECLAEGTAPLVVFSPMISPARVVDASPTAVVHWTRAHGIDGREWPLPTHTVVTSRGYCAKGPKVRHFGLVCESASGLAPTADGAQFYHSSLRNFISGASVGASQVTSVVKCIGGGEGRRYTAALTCKLVYPYVVALTDPIPASTPHVPRRRHCQRSLFDSAVAAESAA